MPQKDRVLIRIEEVSELYFLVIIPGWNQQTKVIIDRELMPKRIAHNLSPGDHVLARVNLGAVSPKQLMMSDFEEAPDPAKL
jgi:hypothetical protein